MQKITFFILLCLTSFSNCYSQIKNLSVFLEAAELTVQGLRVNLQRGWNFSPPVEEIDGNIRTGKYTFSINYGAHEQILQRIEVVNYDKNIKMNRTSLLFNDKKLMDRIKTDLPYRGFKLERELEKEFLYKNGYYTIILRERATEDDDLNKGYYRIEFLDYGEDFSKYVQNSKAPQPKPLKTTNNALRKILDGSYQDSGDDSEIVEEDKSYGIGVSMKEKPYSLGGRRLLEEQTLEEECDESGVVVVQIGVNRKGRVVRATPGGKGTTTSAQCLFDTAKKAAMDSRFNSDFDAPAVQVGFIVYTYK